MKRFNNRKKITKEKIESYNFKEVALTKMAKRQLLVTLFSILGVTIISLGSAYAVFTSVSKSADYNVIKVGTLNIDFGTDSNNTINLTGQYPMSDEEGLKLTPYTFTITNTGNINAYYHVSLEEEATNTLDNSYIRMKLTNNKGYDSGISNVNMYGTGTFNIKSEEVLEPGDKVTYTLWMWLDETADNSAQGKEYKSKIVVTSYDRKQKSLALKQILEDNENLHNKVYQMEHDYKVKSNSLDFRYNNRKEELEKEFEEKAFNLEYEYKHKVHKLEKENTRLHKIIKTFEETVKKFIKWICKKFELPSEDEIVRDFEKETKISLDAEKQIKREERKKEGELER